ncbi:hypothetical protein Tco_1320404 [Tanacetum coccineum]
MSEHQRWLTKYIKIYAYIDLESCFVNNGYRPSENSSAQLSRVVVVQAGAFSMGGSVFGKGKRKLTVSYKSKLPTEQIPGTRTRNNATRIGDKYMLFRMVLQSDINAATI